MNLGAHYLRNVSGIVKRKELWGKAVSFHPSPIHVNSWTLIYHVDLFQYLQFIYLSKITDKYKNF
jgi:hypothetical protein